MRSVSVLVRPASGQQPGSPANKMIEDKQQQSSKTRRKSSSSLDRPQESPTICASQQSQPPSGQKQRRSLFAILFNPKTRTPQACKLDEEGSDTGLATGSEREVSSKKTRDEDADSYVLDLNDRLAIEKLYSHGNAPRFAVVQQTPPPPPGQTIETLEKRREPTKQPGPPSMLAIRTPRVMSSPQPPPQPLQAQPVQPSQVASSGRTCLLEPRFDSLGLSSDEGSEDGASSAASNSSGSSAVSVDFAMDSRAPVKGIDISMSEQDQRLFKWRLLAARTAWAAGSPISSDSELELLDCHTPALVVACSDDTSCSSVELIWSKPARTTNAGPTDSNLSARPASTSPTSNEKSAQRQQQRHHSSTAMSQPSEPRLPLKPSSNQGYLAGFSDKQRNLRQKLSIFELAKPMRGKNKSTPSPSQWVANPLFANGNDDDGHELIDDDTTTATTTSQRHDDNHASSETKIRISSGVAQARLSNGDDDDNDDYEKLKKRRRGKKRWSSIRLKTEHYLGGNNNNYGDDNNDDDKRKSSPETGSLKLRDNIYLNHILNLDRRIKSNVSSLRSQLSETSKRASVLADQLLTSIKDTTKEQFGQHSIGRQRRESTLFETGNEEQRARPEQLFSLIYMHQQPVVTRQPRSAGCPEGLIEPASKKADEAKTGVDEQTPPVVERKEQSSQTTTTVTVSASRSTGDRASRAKRKSRIRRQINVAPPTSDEDEDGDSRAAKRKFRPRTRKVSRSQSLELADLLRH